MHVLYVACAHAKKNIFVKFIELIRSIQNSFEFWKSDENWAQLQALKLRFFDVLIFWCSWCSSLAYLFFFVCETHRKKINKLAKNIKNVKRLEHQKISTSKHVIELSFHSFCKIQTNSEFYESDQYISRIFFFLRARIQRTKHACNILLYILMFVRKIREKLSVFKYLMLWLCCKMTVRRLIYSWVESNRVD
jgi:hypothetical protein